MFDSLWTCEFINNLYESGLQNDKLGVLFAKKQEGTSCHKTLHGMTKKIGIPNIIMQGTVWGFLFCTATIHN